MKKMFLTVSLAALFVSSCTNSDEKATAPIIGGSEATKNFPTSGTITETPFGTGKIAVPKAGENQTFDYGAIALQTPYTFQASNVANATFGSVTSTLPVYANFLNNPQSSEGVSYYNASKAGIKSLGVRYVNDTEINVPNVGSITFLKQNVVNNPVQNLAVFPMTFGQTVSQTISSTTTFTVTTPALPAPNLPARYTDVRNVTTSNFAWGTLKIPGYANAMPTLVQKTTESVKRNYFLINATGGYDPMPIQLLQAVNLTDGAVTTFSTYQYWVAGKGVVLTVYDNGGGKIHNGI